MISCDVSTVFHFTIQTEVEVVVSVVNGPCPLSCFPPFRLKCKLWESVIDNMCSLFCAVEALWSSKILIPTYKSTWHHNPEYDHSHRNSLYCGEL